MKYVIINADDFGYSKSINRGILYGIRHGVISSTSVMVYGTAVNEAAELKNIDKVSVGLHIHMEGTVSNPQEEFDKQIKLFTKVLGRAPDHIDVHKPRKSDLEQLLPLLERYSKETNTPVRELGHAKSIKEFFGIDVKRGGVDSARVETENLIRILESLEEGVSEIMTHAGYTDEELERITSYTDLREKELEVLTSKEIIEYFHNADDLRLVSWNDAPIKFS